MLREKSQRGADFFLGPLSNMQFIKGRGQYQASNTDGLHLNENKGPAPMIGHILTSPGEQYEYFC